MFWRNNEYTKWKRRWTGKTLSYFCAMQHGVTARIQNLQQKRYYSMLMIKSFIITVFLDAIN